VIAAGGAAERIAMEQLLLWRWSTTAQVLSVLMVTVFLLIMRRSSRRRGMGAWTLAWVANCAAMAATLVYWFAQPEGLASRFVTGTYFFAKTLFVLLLVVGAVAFARPARRLPGLGVLGIAAAAFAVAAAAATTSLDAVGVVQAGLVAAIMLPAAGWCARCQAEGLGWFGVGLAVRGGLALAEAAGYGMRLAGAQIVPRETLDFFLGAHSLFDTGAEWAIALGIVLALAHRALAELKRSHDELEVAHQRLREVADTDPLTGLANRRMLPALWPDASAAGGWLLFFDLDGFKRINDAEGHFTGDACLRRFAAALRETFAGLPAVVRFAGDEFVALVPARPRDWVDARVAALRERVGAGEGGLPGLQFSVGVAAMAAGGALEDTLRRADEDMYAHKARRSPA
jgi:diguanylate cyclase (GGDEF)-like protein